ncbi:RagB/SusD family nutrient uptake outer membrane protein [Pedobacter africanus]|uniref:SusD family protein n=1 Tax=Pedobacter africanus TaxID=151894 RepID=A0A1W2CTV6_9SPHI|nr:RagB/SusD family nutrient uptake outer membrane protein [Pedobacter africanus]SMC88657.1 SusD family protein [Pedobacter africanus]
MKSIRIKIAALVLVLALGACKKFLDEKPNQALYVPTKLTELLALIDNTADMNFGYGNSLIEVLADDYYVTYSNWQSAELVQRNHYVWTGETSDLLNWQQPYLNAISCSNVILDQLQKIDKKNDISLSQQIEGSALFLRSFGFYQLAQVYCKPYSETAGADLGIVLRETVDLEAKSIRSTLAETYHKIVTDLNRSLQLLPEYSEYRTRPSKVAAYAMLARVHLSMREYENAQKFADLALELNNKLIDFNDLPVGSSLILPLSVNNEEIIFFSSLNSSILTSLNTAKIDTNLYRSYGADDIRKNVFFIQNTGANAGTYRFRGSYYVRTASTISSVFNGLTTGELYLIKAECLARKGNTIEAMKTLNALLKKRYKRNAFIDFSAGTPTEALNTILTERRKELIFRGQRWTDLRRFNLEGANITLKRKLNDQIYTLPPNDARWVVPIPREEIAISGITQNPY